MGRRARIRRLQEEDAEALLEAPAAAPPKQDKETPATRTLELQRSAGNRAVGAALARWPMRFPQAKTPQWPKEPQVMLDGKVLPLVSYSWGSAPNLGTGGGHGPGKVIVQDMWISTRTGNLSAELALRARQGQPFKSVVIVMSKGDRGYTFTLRDVLVTSFQTDGSTDTWTASFSNYEVGTSPPAP